LASLTKVLLAAVGIVALIVIATCYRGRGPETPTLGSTATATAPNGTEHHPAAAEQPTDPQMPAAALGTASTFPSIVSRFVKLTQAQQKDFSATFKGVALSGKGTVFQSDACDPLDDSAHWGAKCAKLVVDSGPARVVLYFEEKYGAMLAKYQKGRSVTFANCTANSVKNWGFGPTATCDML
jgi:hypothetical protein